MPLRAARRRFIPRHLSAISSSIFIFFFKAFMHFQGDLQQNGSVYKSAFNATSLYR